MATKADLQAFTDTLGPEPHTTAEQRNDGEMSKLPVPEAGTSADHPLPPELRAAWNAYMVNGFRHNEEMFRRTLDAFMRPYNITVIMYVALFVVGLGFFAGAIYLGMQDPTSVAAIAFGGLSVGSFLLFFVRQPLQALEENLEFITWLGVAFNTYWTRLMYLSKIDSMQTDLKQAADDYIASVEHLIDKHAAMRDHRPGRELNGGNKP